MASNGAASKSSAPAIAAEDDSTAVVVTEKDGGVLFKSTKFRIIGMQYSYANHALFLFGEEVRCWGCCHYCKDPGIFGGIIFCRRCLDKGWWVGPPLVLTLLSLQSLIDDAARIRPKNF